MSISSVEKVKSIGDLLAVLPSIYGKKNPTTVWFRGQAISTWKLLPSLLRHPNKLDEEKALIKRFKQYAFPFLEHIPQHEWEWIFLMQHYGVPTRLLDWTESPLVGLYFAVETNNKQAQKKDATLWCLYPKKLNQVANVVLNSPDEIPSFGDDDLLDSYLPSRVAGIKPNKQNPLAIVAPRQFKRLYAQQGVFTISHSNTTSIDEIGDKSHVVRLLIPASSREKVSKELSYLMINELALFPELEKVAKRIREVVA